MPHEIREAECDGAFQSSFAPTHMNSPSAGLVRQARSRWIVRALPVALLLIGAAPAGATAGEVHDQTVVLSGSQAKGLPPGSTLDLFGTPLIDQDGNVGFLAQSLPAGMFENLSAWKVTADGLSLIALAEQQAPGTAEAFTIIGRPQIAGGVASLEAEITQPSGFGIDGIWSDRNGPLELIMLQSDHPPLTPPGSTFHSFVHRLCADGSVVINAVYNDHSDCCFVELANEGLWRNRTGAIEAIAVRHMSAPGTELGVNFDAGTDLAFFGPVDGWAPNALGEVALQGYLGGPGVTTENDEGIWVEGPRGLDLLVREGDPTPGVPAAFLADFGFRTFSGGIAINQHSHVVFSAEIDVHDSLWTNRNGTLELVAIDGLNNPPVPPQPAPGFGPGQVIAGLDGGLINDSDNIAMLGAVWNPGGQFGIQAIWADHSGDMSLIVRRDDPAPGAPGLVFTNTVNIRGYAPDGTIYFSALLDDNGLSPPSSASHYGLFIAEPDGTIHTIVLTGQVFEVVPGDIRTVGEIFPAFNESNFVPGSISDNGTITFQMVFEDGTTGLFTARVGPLAAPGDVNGDGHVDVDDLIGVLLGWGACADCGNCAADFDGDCAVEVDDLIVVILNWG